jgi:acyl-CoA thioesterase
LSAVTADGPRGETTTEPASAPPEGLPDAFHLTEVGERSYVATSIGDPGQRDVVYGGQLLAQMILASDRVADTKEVASIHTVFARSAKVTSPIEIDVGVIHDGRTMGSHSVVVRQGDRVCAQGLVLRRADGPDLIRHQPAMPEVDGPDRSPASRQGGLVAPGSELRVVGGVDTWEPDSAVGPAELFVWVRLPAVTDDPVMGQALLAYGTDGFLIGTAMRPHPGVGQNMAHGAIATGVVSHTLTFHQPVEVGTWLLMAHESTYAGRGASYGRANVFTQDGTLVASFVQESMIKDAGASDSRGGSSL